MLGKKLLCQHYYCWLRKTRRAQEGNIGHDAAHVSGGPTLESKAQSGKTHPPAREVA